MFGAKCCNVALMCESAKTKINVCSKNEALFFLPEENLSLFSLVINLVDVRCRFYW